MTDITVKPRESYHFAVVRARNLPRQRFQDVSEAGVEAERQSRERPGATFIVMKEIARVSCNPVPSVSRAWTKESRTASHDPVAHESASND